MLWRRYATYSLRFRGLGNSGLSKKRIRNSRFFVHRRKSLPRRTSRLLNECVPSLAGRVEARIVPELPPTGAGPGGASKEGIQAIRDAVVLPGAAELPRTLPESLRRAAQNGRADAIIHLTPDGGEKHQSFADLLAEAEGVCGGLLRPGLKAGDSTILLLNDSTEVLPAFWGCLLAGSGRQLCRFRRRSVGRTVSWNNSVTCGGCSTARSSLPAPNCWNPFGRWQPVSESRRFAALTSPH